MNKSSIEDFIVFCEVVKTLNFSQAAKSLGVTPGYVSKRIQALEQEIGCKLFNRSTRQVILTEQGESAYRLGSRILDSVQELQEDIAISRNEPKGVLRVSTSFGFGRRIVGPALAEFSAIYPAIKINLEVCDQILDLVKHKIDLDVRIGDEISPHYIARRLAKNYRVLCAAPSYLMKRGTPTEPRELLTHDCLVIKERDHPVGIWKLSYRDTAQTYNIKVDGALVTNNGEVAVTWALEGRGIILRSIWDVGTYLNRGDLVPVLPDLRQEANVWAVYPERLESSAKIKLCVRHLQQYFSCWNTCSHSA